jgi:type II secretory ATPase GspE/PulE/Tfp pilus assembly ATPase PilB-like protein
MPYFLFAAIEYSGYLSIIKLVIFLILFVGWLPIINWVYQDSKTIESKEGFWTGVVLGGGAAGAIIWLMTPFIIGILVYVVAVAATSLAYVKYRNSRVLETDKVLNVEHIRSLFESKEKKVEGLKGFAFVTANNNDVPIPEPRTPDFLGFRTTYDIMSDAIWRRANTVAFTPTPQDYQVAYYVDGTVQKQPNMPIDQVNYFIHFIKNLADLDIKEKRKPQKGKFKIRQDKVYTPWEVTTAGSTAGEQVRLKLLVQENITKLSDIGLMPEQYQQLIKFREVKGGVFIITGPEKNGVTTTLYALLRNHDAFINSITTLERQPSYPLPNVVQNVYSLSDSGTTTFAKKLRTIVRMGSDILGIADCEDAETARIACEAAADGKLIYLTLKADSVIQALNMWLKFVEDRNLATQNLLGISNQRLIRLLCNECKEAYTPDKEYSKKFNISPEKTKVLYRAGKVQYDKHGKASTCENCQGTGFVGRTAVFEMITINPELANIIQSKPLTEIGKEFRRAKFLYLQEQILRKVMDGTTAINEMVRVLKPKETEIKTA